MTGVVDLLLREVTGRVRGIPSYRDTELSGDTFSLGSAPDQQIQLLGRGVQPVHGVLRPSGGRASIQCRRPATVTVNGEIKRSATVGPGDVLEVGGHTLTVIESPAGFDLALEIVPDPNVDSSAYEAAFVTDLDQTWLSRRGPSWVLLALVLLVTLAVPLAYVLLAGPGETGPAVAPPTAPHAAPLVAGIDRKSGTPPDLMWISGPLHPVHALAAGNDCSACHSSLFQRVKDGDCRVCHDALSDHVAAPRMASLAIPHTRCATCHREHNEPERLIIPSGVQCTSCHADPHQFAEPMKVAAVSGFGLDTHPAFRAELQSPVVEKAGTGLSFRWRSHVELVAGAREDSNLVFPHDVHLDAVKVRSPNTNEPLHCSDCHRLSADGEHFGPIDMETHCGSCHELTFDPTAPDRQLPHGKPREVAFAIEGYYSTKFLNPSPTDTMPTRRRLPGHHGSTTRCNDSPAKCAEQQAQKEVVNQFTVRGCVTCHTVTDTGSGDLYSRFQVHPVKLVRDYFPTVKFDHVSHLTQKDKTGDEACLSCHPARRSHVSSDLLMPDIDNCTGCHGDPSVPDVVVLECIGCHRYHPQSFASAGDAGTMAERIGPVGPEAPGKRIDARVVRSEDADTALGESSR